MAATFVEICNSALTLIGANPIAALSDNTKEAKLCNQHYVGARQAVLRTFMFQFASTRKTLYPTFVTITLMADNGSGLIRVTSVAHGLQTNDRVTVASTVGLTADGTYKVTRIDADNFDLQSSTWNGAFTSSTYTVAPQFEFAYQISLPSGFLRLIAVDTEDYRLENNLLLTNCSSLRIRYSFDVTDPTKFDPLFDEAYAHYLAWKICIRLSESTSLKDELWKSYMATDRVAKFIGSSENPPGKLETTDWIDSRVTSDDVWIRGG